MLQVLLSGLAVGAIYGLVGMGYAVVFYVTRVINFAQGQLLMVGVMVTAATASIGWPPLLSVVVGILSSCVFGSLTYLLAVRPVLAFNRIGFAWLVSTLGFALVLENVAALIWGPTSRSFPYLLNNVSVRIGHAGISLQQILAIVVAIVITPVFELIRKRTLFGKLGMAVATDPEMAAAVGVNPLVVALLAFTVAGLFSGIAGALVGPLTYANPYLGDTYGIYGFVAMMIGGGTEKPVAAMLGGLLLGILAQGANALINSQAADWFPFIVLVVVLIIAPKGLFGSGNFLQRLFGSKQVGEIAG
ncbi:MAG: branched-chain amino acid ABC transporter permease [Alicyclobacillus sp.]|nr:branched-chain amino acid ABC transporter permease [Alicyclobacillus sp.]